jgi:hypothetical protein
MNTQEVPGLLLPTVNAQIGNTQSQSAIIASNDAALKMNKMNNELAGGRKRKYRRHNTYRRGGAIVVPQFQMSYTPQNGPGQDPNSQIRDNAAIGTQAAANSVYDSQALKFGGSNPDWNWGCHSGGKKKRRTTNKRRTRTKKRRTFKKTRRHTRK